LGSNNQGFAQKLSNELSEKTLRKTCVCGLLGSSPGKGRQNVAQARKPWETIDKKTYFRSAEGQRVEHSEK
jgi:hypothetical protein